MSLVLADPTSGLEALDEAAGEVARADAAPRAELEAILHTYRAEAHRQAHDHTSAAIALRRARKVLADLPRVTEAKLTYLEVTAALYRSEARHDDALDVLDEALDLAGELGLAERRPQIHEERGANLLQLGLSDRARAAFELGLAELPSWDRSTRRLRIVQSLAAADVQLGHHRTAQRRLAAARQLFAAAGDEMAWAQREHLLGVARSHLGRAREAEEHLRAALAAFLRLERGDHAVRALIDLARLLLRESPGLKLAELLVAMRRLARDSRLEESARGELREFLARAVDQGLIPAEIAEVSTIGNDGELPPN